MARPQTRVLPFPVPPDPQLSALPFGSPETVVLHYTRLLTRISKLAAIADPDECLQLLGNCALDEQIVDRIETLAKARVERLARQIGLIA